MNHLEQAGGALGALIQQAIAQAVEDATKPLREELAWIREMTDENVDTKTAMRILGVGRGWLERERARPGTLIVCPLAGTKPTYSRASLYAHKQSRIIRPYVSAKPNSQRGQ